MSEPVTIDSEVYRSPFYGILNAQGQFWTPIPFDSKLAAKVWLDNFIARDPERYGSMKATHAIVPVRIQLTALTPDDGEVG